MLILFRVQFTNNQIATIGNLNKINLINSEFDQYITYLNELISLKDDHYKTESIKAIIFSYIIKDGKIENNFSKLTSFKDGEHKLKDFMTYYQYKLPIAFDPLDYENVLKLNKYDYIVPLKNDKFIKIKYINNKSTKCSLYFKNQLILEYTDTKINENTFVRKINKNKYTFVKGKLDLMETVKKLNI